MKQSHDPGANKRSAPITDQCASELLALGLMGDRRPIDGVIDRLCEPDGFEWLNRLSPLAQSGPKGPDAEALLRGRCELDELRRLIDAAKSSMAEARTCDEALEATVTYFFTLAAGMAHCNDVLSSRSRQELDLALLDLADSCPPRWANLLRKAVEICPVRGRGEGEQKE